MQKADKHLLVYSINHSAVIKTIQLLRSKLIGVVIRKQIVHGSTYSRIICDDQSHECCVNST